MTTVVMGALAGMVGVGAFLVVTGLMGRQVITVRWSGRLGKLASSLGAVRVAAAVAAGAGVLVLTGWPVGAALASASVVAGPHLLGGRSGREASIARTEAIAAWTEMVRDSIAAASGLEEAILATAGVAPPAISAEVTTLVRRLEHQSLSDALAAFGDDVSHPSADLVVAALSIAARMEASDMTGLLSRLSDAIRGEARMRIRVEVGRTRVRTATRVIVGVVGATIALLAVLNRSYLAAYDSPGGQMVLLLVGAIFAAGGWMLLHMSELEMPERFSARSAVRAEASR